MKNVGEKPTDEEADNMIKETDVDDAQQKPHIPQGRASE